jgi:hypothetical protein
LAWSLQTNTDLANHPVRALQRSLGFQTAGVKRYDNRVDVIMWRTAA